MSKGSSPRPFSVSNQEYSNKWDAIFGRDNEKKNEEKALESARPNSTRNSGSSDNTSSDTRQAQIP